MNYFLTIVLFFSLCSLGTAQTTSFNWAKPLNTSSLNPVTVDASNDVYSTGSFSGTVNFDLGASNTSLTSNGANGLSAFIYKTEETGAFEWVKEFVGNSDAFINAIKASNNHLYFSGYFTGTLDADLGTGVTNLTASMGQTSFFYEKAQSNGDLVWAIQVDGANGGIFVQDDNGNSYIVSNFGGTVDADPGPNTLNFTAGGGADFFILKLDDNGNFIWAKHFANIGTSNSAIAPKAIALDGSGNVIVVGNFVGTVDFDPGAGVTSYASTFTVQNDDDAFILKLDNNGNFIWANHLTGVEDVQLTSLAVDQGIDNIYVGGMFEGTANLESGSTFNVTSAGQTDIFVQRYNALGQLVWSEQIGATGYDEVNGMDVDSLGALYLTGRFENTVDFDPSSTAVANLVSAGSGDIFIQKLSAFGQFEWIEQLGSTSLDRGTSLVVSNNTIYTTGDFRALIDFDYTTGTNFVSPIGFQNAFILSMALPINTSTATLATPQLQLYPSPSQGALTIELGQQGEATVSILDNQGRLAHPSILSNETTLVLSLSDLPTGVYYISVQQAGQTSISKWVKQ